VRGWCRVWESETGIDTALGGRMAELATIRLTQEHSPITAAQDGDRAGAKLRLSTIGWMDGFPLQRPS
jgi:hypothetical protein